MEQQTRKGSIFEMTQEEILEHIRPTAEAAIKAAFDKNSYITYIEEELCPEGTMIREYKDRKELVGFDDMGKAQLIRLLPKG
jgi:hypothetical protein